MFDMLLQLWSTPLASAEFEGVSTCRVEPAAMVGLQAWPAEVKLPNSVLWQLHFFFNYHRFFHIHHLLRSACYFHPVFGVVLSPFSFWGCLPYALCLVKIIIPLEPFDSCHGVKRSPFWRADWPKTFSTLRLARKILGSRCFIFLRVVTAAYALDGTLGRSILSFFSGAELPFSWLWFPCLLVESVLFLGRMSFFSA